MSVNEIILFVMAAFAVLGALDRIFGNRLGLGKQLEEGILAMGSLALSMLGILCLAPVLAKLLKPVLAPLFGFLGADPAMFAGTILANDMGGAPLAEALAESPEAAQLGGLIVGAMLGATLVFTVPVALGIISGEDHAALGRGVLAGIVTIPLGVLAGGLTAGFPLLMILKNLTPIALFAALLALGLWKWERSMIRGFLIFGKGVVAVITVGLGAALFEALTGIVLIPGMNPIGQEAEVVAEIAFVLAGAFPLVYALTRLLKKPLLKLGALMGMNEVGAAGLVASLANSIPMLGMLKDMDARGKILNIAFAVSAAFVFGDHLGFTAGYNSALLLPVIVAKLTGGITALLLALWMTGQKGKRKKRNG